MWRSLYNTLLDWKNDDDRSVLLLEGVRQCGKTHLLKEFGSECFTNMIYIDFEKEPEAHGLFDGNLDPKKIIDNISIYKNADVTPGKTLIVFDEIQACGRALTSVKYFTDEAPEYHVACAGSLIGLAINKDSFPVGKVNRVRLYPMTFLEFLRAEGEEKLFEYLQSHDPTEPISGTLHEMAMEHLRNYYLVGGMPKAVQSWITHRSIPKVTSIQKSLLKDYRNDFSKHGSDILAELIAIWNAIPNQLMKENRRMTLKDVIPRGRTDMFTAPLEWMSNAGLIHCVYMADSPFVPLSTVKKESMFKVYLCDVGLLRAMTGVPPSFVLSKSNEFKIIKGAMAENFAVCSINASGYDDTCCYWKCEKNEVDLLISSESGVVPVEVKYGNNKVSASLREYQDRYHPEQSVFLSANEPKEGDTAMIPLYYAERVLQYLSSQSKVV